MDEITLLGIAVALGTDAFAVAAAVAAGLPVLTGRHTFRLVWHFGLFQGLMTIAGWCGGGGISMFMSGINCWIAFGLLVFLGAKMIYESRDPESRSKSYDPTRGWSLVALSIATSIDALAVGISMSLIGVSVWRPALLIALVALVMTFVGTRSGKHGGVFLGKWAECLGGIVLIIIGIRILVEYLLHGTA